MMREGWLTHTENVGGVFLCLSDEIDKEYFYQNFMNEITFNILKLSLY